MKIISLISLLVLMASFGARAAQPPFKGYAYLGLGVSNVEVGGDIESDITNGLAPAFDEDDVGLSLIWGSRYSENLGFELAFNDFGKHKGEIIDTNSNVTTDWGDISVESYSFGSNFIFPLNQFDVYIVFGAHLWRSRFVEELTSSRFDGLDFYYGIGGTYHINNDISAGLRFSRYNLNKSFFNTSTQTSIDSRLGALTANFNYHFK